MGDGLRATVQRLAVPLIAGGVVVGILLGLLLGWVVWHFSKKTTPPDGADDAPKSVPAPAETAATAA